MDSNAGEFVDESRAEAWMQRIGVGEVVKIKGEELEVVSIVGREITLKLLSHEDRVRAVFDDAVPLATKPWGKKYIGD